MLQRVDLLRHGEPLGGPKYRGHTDHPLSALGWRQMRESVARRGAEREDWDAIIHSPLSRCAAFAAELATRLNIPATVDERLKEIGFGVWEDRTADSIRAEDAGALARFYHDPVNHQPQGAEPLREFYARVSEAWQDITGSPRQRLLLVAHTGVIRAIVANVLSLPLSALYRMEIGFARIVTIRFSDERPPTLIL